MNEKFTIVLGAVLAVLNAFGIINADESAKLLDYGISTVSGAVGIYLIIKGIVKRIKEKRELKAREVAGEVKAPDRKET